MKWRTCRAEMVLDRVACESAARGPPTSDARPRLVWIGPIFLLFSFPLRFPYLQLLANQGWAFCFMTIFHHGRRRKAAGARHERAR